MVMLIRSILLLAGLVYVSTAFGTNHDLYEMQYWSVENYRLRPVTVTITNAQGQIELQKTLSSGEEYTQEMNPVRRQGEALYKSSFQAHLSDSGSELDYDVGGNYQNMIGTIKIRIPYFYYNKNLDKTGCMVAS
jgi:hypothetical protein